MSIQSHNTALIHAHSHHPELGVWWPWVAQDGCEKQVCFTSSESYAMHLAIFHRVYASWDPNMPNYWVVKDWLDTHASP